MTGTADPLPRQPAETAAGGGPVNPSRLDALLRLTGQGDIRAYGRLYDLTVARIWGLIRSILKDRNAAEDATQDVYFEIWRRAASFDSTKGPALTWMLMLAHARSVERVRRTGTLSSNAERPGQQALRPSLDLSSIEHIEHMEHMIRTENDRQVHAVLAALTPLQRQAIHLTYFLGHSNAEASRLLGVPLPIFKDRIRTALHAMRSTASPG